MANKIFLPKIETPETVVEMGRLSGLSDSVFAFALTLLVLDIKIPEDTLSGDLWANLLALAPRLFIYLISFIIIGSTWGSQQRMLSQIKRGDGVLVWLSLLSLFFVTLIPASAALLGRFPRETAAILCFALNVILLQLAALWVWRHTGKYQLLNPALDPRVVGGIGRRLILSAAAFGLSIPIAFLNPILGYLLWIGLFVLIFATDWLSWQQTLLTLQTAIPLEGAARGELKLKHAIGLFTLQEGAAKDVLVEGTFGGGLDMNSSREGDLIKSELSARKRRGFMSFRYPWAWGPANTLDWNVRLNSEIPLSLTVETRTGQANLDLSELHLTNFTLEMNACSAAVILPAHAGETKVKVVSSLSYSELQVPPGVEALIHSENAMTDELLVDANRFAIIQDGREYRSLNYETAENRVDIELDVSLGTVKIV